MYINSLASCGHVAKLRLRKPRVLLAFIADMCVPFQVAGNGYAKILDFLYIIDYRSLLGIGSIDLLEPIPRNLRYIAFDWLESPCPNPKRSVSS